MVADNDTLSLNESKVSLIYIYLRKKNWMILLLQGQKQDSALLELEKSVT